MGMMRGGLTATDALNKYAMLTIGDGLVSQIPSLMISLATGILVTKVSKEADIGDLLVKQLFSIPKVLYMVGGSMVFLGIFTPLPFFIFCPYGLAFLATAAVIRKKTQVEEIEAEASIEETSAEEIRRPENVTSLLHVDFIDWSKVRLNAH